MKKQVYILMLLLGLSWGCEDFLEESSQDQAVPKTVTDYKEFLYGEAINNSLVLSEYLDFMTDDVADLTNPTDMLANDFRISMWSYYTWQAYPEVGLNNEMSADNAWESYYHKILVTNVILDAIGDMDGSEQEKNDLAGECYFMRAHSYFMLANLYGKPYIDATAAKQDFCVPINDEVSISKKMFERASVAEVYARMEGDLKAAVRCFKAAGLEKTIYRPNLPTTYLLLSRVALFQKKYEEVIAFADSVLANTKGSLCDLNTYKKEEKFFSSLNTELLFTYGYANTDLFKENAGEFFGGTGFFVPNPDLLKLYKEKDLRLACFYSGKAHSKPNKWDSYANVYANAYRLAEVYLNRAEAYAELGQLEKAVNDVNALRQKRFSEETPLPMGSKDAVIQSVREERRMEFAFEGFRWFDLRRWDRPRIVHRYNSADEPGVYEEYVLEANSISYTLPIPQKERDRNTVIERIKRPESVAK